MFRFFRVSDSGLISRLGQRSIPLDSVAMLAQPYSPIQLALRSLIKKSDLTHVWRTQSRSQFRSQVWGLGRGGHGFAISRLDTERTHARLLWIGAGESTPLHPNEDNLLTLISNLVGALSQMGVQTLSADVPENGPLLPILRRAGFAVYTRQEIWQLKLERLRNLGNPEAVVSKRKSHDWDVERLYARAVPNMIRMVEPNPSKSRDSWVVYGKSQLCGYATMLDGSTGSWLNLLMSMDSDLDAKDVLGSVLAQKPPTSHHPIYMPLRNYQEWMHTALTHHGFELFGTQAVMVKHTVQRVEKEVLDLEEIVARQTVKNGQKARSTGNVTQTRVKENN